MPFTLETSVNVLWENLIALNASLLKETKLKGEKLSRTKKLLEKEIKVSKGLQTQIKKQKDELLEKNKKIARMLSKLVAVRQIILRDSEDEHIDNSAMTLPIIVKVESVESVAAPSTVDNRIVKMLPVNVCALCDKKFCSSRGLKRHIADFHAEPTIPCPYCPSKFARSDYVKRHIQGVHGIRSTKSSTQSGEQLPKNN